MSCAVSSKISGTCEGATSNWIGEEGGAAYNRRPAPVIDLHLHSTASDGSLRPPELVRRARDGGLAAIALTDHDTFDGIDEAINAGVELGIEVVPGVEISIEHRPGTFHMIGLLLDPRNEPLCRALSEIRGGRNVRNRQILENLAELGRPLSAKEVEGYAGGDVVARPHFARAMVARGYVGTVKEAFDRYLGKGAPAYAERARFTADEAIRLVHGAGGVTVLCHPMTLGFSRGPGAGGKEKLVGFAEDLAGGGLDAIEVWYSEHDPAQEAMIGDVARRAGLLSSGGSDFHGMTKKDVRLGVGRGNLRIPVEVLDALKARAERIRAGERT